MIKIKINYLFQGFWTCFLPLSERAIVSYKIDNFYNKEFYSGIRYDDKSINIAWELNEEAIIISEKDRN